MCWPIYNSERSLHESGIRDTSCSFYHESKYLNNSQYAIKEHKLFKIHLEGNNSNKKKILGRLQQLFSDSSVGALIL